MTIILLRVTWFSFSVYLSPATSTTKLLRDVPLVISEMHMFSLGNSKLLWSITSKYLLIIQRFLFSFFPSNIFKSIAKNVYHILPEAVTRRCSLQKLFLKTSQNSREITCVGVSVSIKLQAHNFKFSPHHAVW